MAIFFTSDTHFGHGGALGLYQRSFPSVVAMNEAIVERWNATVGPDVFARFSRPTARVFEQLLGRLNGRKHLVTGNNDAAATIEASGWQSVQPYTEITVEGLSLVLCHYPFRTWRGMAKGCLNLHGHCHGRLKPQPRQFDVGVDVWEFRPVTLRTILDGAPSVAHPGRSRR